MVDLFLSVGRLLVALFLVFLNGFFVAAEFAYVRIRPTTVERLVETGSPGAESLQTAVGALDDYLAVTQLGITIASLGLGWAGEPAVAALIEPVLSPVLPERALHLVAFAIGFGLVTYLHVVFGELAPKTIALARVERVALLVAVPMRGFYYLFYPGLVVFNGTANFVTRLFGIPPASESEEILTEEEILMVLSQSGREGNVDAREVEMIEQVFELDDTTVREVMVPRPDVVSVSPDTSLAELRRLVVEEAQTRYPVIGGDEGDEVLGFVDVKDVVRATEATGSDETTASDLARNLPVVPETARIDDLLSEFQSEQVQMAAVIDEYGVFEGIATVEDVVEVVVGDIRDQFDVDEREPSIRRREDGTFVADGGVPVSTVNDVLETDFAADDVETIAGLVLDRLGRMPEAGDTVDVDSHRLTVENLEGTRIATIAVGVVADPEEGDDGEPFPDGEDDAESPDAEDHAGNPDEEKRRDGTAGDRTDDRFDDDAGSPGDGRT
jgi:CBS domain containing-hemolysin-like protein